MPTVAAERNSRSAAFEADENNSWSAVSPVFVYVGRASKRLRVKCVEIFRSLLNKSNI